jgi:glycosyltransferase involved in cell wall biosynthesis
MVQVILDITQLINDPIRTGIQRVLRELIRYWPEPRDLKLARFEPDLGLVSLPRSVLTLILDADETAQEASPENLRKLLAEKLGEAAPPLPEEAVILMAELFYDPARCAWYRQLLRTAPNEVYFFVHDFIPWLFPHRVGVRWTAPFMHYLQLVREATKTAFNSRQTRAEYSARVKRCQVAECGPVLPLGADGLSLERQSFSPTKRSWVVVGAINGNKNQDKIFAAFQKLWRNGFRGNLVLVGRVYGADSTSWLKEAAREPSFRHIIDVPDETLRDELRNARATIYVSEVEGFGLPPVESLYAGIPAIVTSSIPSISDLPPSGQIRLTSAEVHEIAAAVEATADDITAERLWHEAAALRLSTWRDFAVHIATWIEEEHRHDSLKHGLANAR